LANGVRTPAMTATRWPGRGLAMGSNIKEDAGER
jgi:hypothetical protein